MKINEYLCRTKVRLLQKKPIDTVKEGDIDYSDFAGKRILLAEAVSVLTGGFFAYMA